MDRCQKGGGAQQLLRMMRQVNRFIERKKYNQFRVNWAIHGTADANEFTGKLQVPEDTSEALRIRCKIEGQFIEGNEPLACYRAHSFYKFLEKKDSILASSVKDITNFYYTHERGPEYRRLELKVNFETL